MPKVFPAPKDVEGEATRLLLTLWLTTALSVLGIAGIAAVVWVATPPLVLDQTFLSQFTLDAVYFYADQPGKSLAFDIGCAISPFVIALSYAASSALVRKMKDSSLATASRLAVMIFWLFFLWCLSALVFCPNPPLEGMPPSWLLSKWFFVAHDFRVWSPLLCLGLICGFVAHMVRRGSKRGNRRLSFLMLLLLLVLLAPSDAYTRSQISDEWRFTYHFNVVTHALTQVINGHHLLVHFPHIYGGYIEFLGPVLALFPRRIETLLLPFPLLHGAAALALLLTARLVIRDAALLFIMGLGLLGLQFILPNGDHCYPYDPIRTVFPALGVWATTLFFRRPTRLKYVAVSGVAALAPLWNLDTGMVLWLSWTATLFAAQLGERKPLHALRDLAIQASLLIAVMAAFLLYLRIMSGAWPDPSMLITFQKLVVGSGYLCFRMLVPDIWIILLTAYTIGLVTAFHFHVQKAASWRTHCVLMFSLMGIGLFSYFTGRSAESNMAAASYPALLLVGILLDETRRMIRRNKLPRIIWALLLPPGLMAGWWAFVFTMALPDLAVDSGNVLMTWRDATETPFQTNAAFVQKWTLPGDNVFMLSNQSGFYYYLTDTTCPIDIPGPGELMRSVDMNKLADNLISARFPKLFVEQNFYTVGTYKPEVRQRLQEIISHHYRAVATSATGQIMLYVPR